MRVLERLHLAPKKSVEIVTVGSRILVLGVTEERIGLLTELASEELPETSPEAAGTDARLTPGRKRALLNEARHKFNELFRSARASDVEAAPTQ
jgi:flagellar biogenesis protein FliO